MEFVFITILAIAQGVAEFLPISSSGHLAVLGQLFGFDAEQNVQLNVVLHFGTLVAIVVYYWKHLWTMVLNRSKRPLIGWVILGSVPAAIVGLGVKKLGLEGEIFNNYFVVGAGFLITATLLRCAMKKSNFDAATEPLESLTWKKALTIGIAQGIAVCPGISRSGSTIATALQCKLDPAASAEFSFLLAIPAIGGAALLDFVKVWKESVEQGTGFTLNSDFFLMLWGGVAAAVVGYISLRLLMVILKKGKLTIFSNYLYCVAVLVFGLAFWQLFGL